MPIKYASIDIETTGRKAEHGLVLELAIVVETDWQTPVDQLPHYRCFVGHDAITGEAGALAMNARIIAELAQPIDKRSAPTVRNEWVAAAVRAFLTEHIGPPPWNIGGKNAAGFDLRFLERLHNWRTAEFRHRVFDPAPLWLDPFADDAIPDTATCLARAELTNDRPHEALEDARAVVKLNRRAFARDRFRVADPAA